MGRLATNGVITGSILMISIFASAAGAAPRGGFAGPGVAPQSPQVMLYFSHSMGAGGAPRPTFGLRVQQVRQGGNFGDPDSGDVMHHRELINWQMEAHSNFHLANLRMQLGHRVTYDLLNRRFGGTAPSASAGSAPGAVASRATLQFDTRAQRTGSIEGSFEPAQPKSVFGASSLAPSRPAVTSPTTVGRLGEREDSDTSNIREVALAAMSALAPSRFTQAQQQTRLRGAMASPRESSRVPVRIVPHP